MALPVGLLTVWRHKLAAAAGANAPGFVPVRIASEGCFARQADRGRVAFANTMPGRGLPPGQFRGEIEIEGERGAHLGRAGVDATTLSTVLSALRGGA